MISIVTVLKIAIVTSGILKTSCQSPSLSTRTEKIFYKSGEDIRLKCPKNDSYRYNWELLRCGFGYTEEKCHHIKNIPETDLPWISKCGDYSDCKSRLIITNSTQKDSGLYRCSVQLNSVAIGSVILKTFEIYVVDLNKSEHIPEMLPNDTTNITNVENTQVVLRCSVFSVIPVKISWLKEVQKNPNSHSTQMFSYVNKTYVKINSSHVVRMSNNVYLSKLTLLNTAENDSGIYTCLAINSKGINFTNTHVKIIPAIQLQQDQTSFKSFSILFLVPVAFALIPIIAWLCYFKRKKHISFSAINCNGRTSQYLTVAQNNNVVNLEDNNTHS